jgi:phage terminase large subunit GpA-like protein
VAAAKAPRNPRRHDVRVLLVNEADAMEATAEGNPIELAEKRTLSFADRKIIVGSTPLAEDGHERTTRFSLGVLCIAAAMGGIELPKN